MAKAPPPKRPPTYGITGGYWPQTGTVPQTTDPNPAPAFDPEYPNWSVTQDVAGAYILQSWPVGSPISPSQWQPRVMVGSWLYIPTLASGDRLYKVLSIGKPFGANNDSCRLTLDRAVSGLGVGATAQVEVVESVNVGGAGLPCRVYCQTAGAEVSGAPMVADEWTKVCDRPFEYDATAGVLAITVNPPQ